MLGRRRFLALLGMSPIAAKTAADQAAMVMTETSQMGLPGFEDHFPIHSRDFAGRTPGGVDRFVRRQLVDAALSLKSTRDDLESKLYQQHRRVTVLDPDIACMKSFSLNAKITFQRQRNVQREMQRDIYGEYDWTAVDEWKNKIFGGD